MTVTYDRNGATGGAVPTDAVAYDGVDSVTVIGNTGALNWSGYTFSGWNTAANGSGTGYDPGDVFVIAASLTLYAVWSSATSLITPTQLREHMSTDLSDEALQAIIDAEEASLNDYFGSLGTQVEEFDDAVPGDLIFTSRTISTISSIVEKYQDTFIGGYNSVPLDTTDYEIVPGNKAIRRLGTGTHPVSRWGRRVVVTYTPSTETAKRVLALINLCKLNAVYNGLKSESVGGGEYSMTQGDYDNQRAQILAGLASTHRSYA
ncbi:MAG: InlB B-repeat-containing protein [Patescibacteria group bacterium]